MVTDSRVQQHVLDALHFNPEIEPAKIGVEVDSGVVTLFGVVESDREKRVAEHVALELANTRAVANELLVRHPMAPEPTDALVAARAVQALDWTSSVPQGRVKVGVSRGSVVLEGTVNREYEKIAAERVVRRVAGAREVTNLIIARPISRAVLPPEEAKP